MQDLLSFILFMTILVLVIAFYDYLVIAFVGLFFIAAILSVLNYVVGKVKGLFFKMENGNFVYHHASA